jgi:hypothetical protein
MEKKIESDIEYLDIHFPKEIYYKGVKKPESQMRGEAMVLIALARQQGKILERKRILKLFKFELDNQVTSYETLVKLRKLKEDKDEN